MRSPVRTSKSCTAAALAARRSSTRGRARRSCSRTAGTCPRNQEGIALDRRSAQRRACVREPDAGRVHPCRTTWLVDRLARGGRRRERAFDEARRGHLALPVADRQRLSEPRPSRARSSSTSWTRPGSAPTVRTASRSSRSSSPTPPTATATRSPPALPCADGPLSSVFPDLIPHRSHRRPPRRLVAALRHPRPASGTAREADRRPTAALADRAAAGDHRRTWTTWPTARWPYATSSGARAPGFPPVRQSRTTSMCDVA